MKVLKISRSILIIFLLLSFYSTSYTQANYRQMMDDYSYTFYEVVEAAEAHFSKNDKGKGSGYKQYMRWRYLNEGKYAPSGDRQNVDHRISAKAYERFLKESTMSNKKAIQATWKELGPDYSEWYHTPGLPYGIGRVEAIWVNPSNEEEIFMSSRSGGFWKTTDEGDNWVTTTDELTSVGVNTFSVNPFNHNEILINVQSARDRITNGIYKSSDRGNTWTLSSFNPDNPSLSEFATSGNIWFIKYHPKISGMVFIGTSNGVYRSENNLDNFSHVLTGQYRFNDLEFHPGNSGIVYLLDNGLPNVFISYDGGATFPYITLIGSNYAPLHQIAVSPAAPNNIWYASSEGIWKSTDNGQSFNFMVKPPEIISEFAVSDVDPSKLLTGYVNLFRTNTGQTLINCHVGSLADDNKYIHVDMRTLECVNGTFYAGTDGYLAKSIDNGISWKRLNEKGTGIRENYFLDVSQSDNQYYITGCQDNGVAVHDGDEWYEIRGGDGMECIIHPLNNSWLLASHQEGKSFYIDKGRISVTGSSKGIWFEPFFQDPNDPMKLYAFDGNTFNVADSYRMNWQTIGNHGWSSIQSKADISYQNSSNIIASDGGSKIKLSTNGGQHWTDIKNNLPITGISALRINPSDSHNFIVASDSYGTDMPKVFITFNRGQNWTDISHNLTHMPIRSVEIDHSPEQNIYLGTSHGIFTKPINSAITSWTKYSTGLPNVSVMDMEIHYGSNELFATTWGRGTWKVDLVNRESYPKITTTRICDGPTDIQPTVGSMQEVTSTIEYNGTLTKVDVHWARTGPNFINQIPMINTTGNTWVSSSPLPSEYVGQRILFKVVATGSNNDTSETYKFSYKVKGGSVLKGDVNMDGTLNILDAQNTAQYVVNIFKSGICNSLNKGEEICTELADINCDGVVNILDAYQIARCAVGLPDAECTN